MSLPDAILLGILQGATEFLPISSSGHLVMGQALLGIRLPGVLFEVALHVATLLSVVFVYRARLLRLAAGALRGEGAAWRYLAVLAVGTVPAAAFGLLFRGGLEGVFERPAVTGMALLVTGAFLWSVRWVGGRGGRGDLRWGDALLVGGAQAVALLPGISRSGATVVTALWLRVRPEEAAEYSFLLAIPAIVGAALLQLPELRGGASGIGMGTLGAGFAAAAATGVVAIRFFLALLRRGSFHRFAVYCWTVGGAFLIHLAVR